MCSLSTGDASSWTPVSSNHLVNPRRKTSYCKSRTLSEWINDWTPLSHSALFLCHFSQGEEAAVQRWLPDASASPRGYDYQSRTQGGVPGYVPAPQPLLHILLTQHLPHGGSAQRAQQHRGLCQVTNSSFFPFDVLNTFRCYNCDVLI